jgi:hypothetical protein
MTFPVLFQNICPSTRFDRKFQIRASQFTHVYSIRWDECGLSFIWNDQTHMNRNVLKSVLKQKLLDQYIQHWFQQINSSSRGEFYGIDFLSNILR